MKFTNPITPDGKTATSCTPTVINPATGANRTLRLKDKDDFDCLVVDSGGCKLQFTSTDLRSYLSISFYFGDGVFPPGKSRLAWRAGTPTLLYLITSDTPITEAHQLEAALGNSSSES